MCYFRTLAQNKEPGLDPAYFSVPHTYIRTTKNVPFS